MSTTPELLDQRHRLRERPLAGLAGGVLTWREAGGADRPAIVMLHGIGSGSLGFASQLAHFAGSHRVLAWDAPGYGQSAGLPHAQPFARDYAAVLAEWLHAEGVRACDVLGHSLGALVAAAFAADAAPARGIEVRGLVLASPALGYGDQPDTVRMAKQSERVALIQRLGPHGMAAERAARLCTPAADAVTVEMVRWNMARTTPAGYAQAAHLLAQDSLRPYAARAATRIGTPIQVLCGELDTVTPAAASASFAQSVAGAFTLLRGAAHACYVEHADAFNAALRTAIDHPVPTVAP